VSALLPLLALAAAALDDPRLDVTRAVDVAAAVRSCRSAVTGRTRVNPGALEADGWKQAELRGPGVVRRKPGNAAIIMSMRAQSGEFPASMFREVCFVRGRLHDARALRAVAHQITSLTRIEPYVSRRKPDKWLWRGTSTWISMEPFDAAADGTPVTQIAVLPAPAWPAWQRPTQNASSQDNQEPR
jgi:hypothetical protein